MSTLPRLIQLAGVGGVGIVIMLELNRFERDKALNRSSFLQAAVHILQSQPEVIALIGQKYQVGKVRLNDGWSRYNMQELKIKVPIQGELDGAVLLAYGKKTEENLELHRVEMIFNSVKGKKAVLFDDKIILDEDPEKARVLPFLKKFV